MPRLRIIAPGDSDESEISMSEAIERIMKECAAASPTTVFVAWESKDTMTCRTLPDSVMVKKGFILTLYNTVFEDDEDGE